MKLKKVVKFFGDTEIMAIHKYGGFNSLKYVHILFIWSIYYATKIHCNLITIDMFLID